MATPHGILSACLNRISDADIDAALPPPRSSGGHNRCIRNLVNCCLIHSDITIISTTLTFLFHLLLHHPSTLAALEADLLSPSSPIHNLTSSPSPASAVVPYAQTLPHKYLSSVITETFRFAPVFTMPLMRVVPSPSAIVAGERLPGGTDVSVCNAVLHHDPAVSGEDAGTFRPERWLDGGYTAAHKEQLFGFGAGHRACIGRNLAMVEIGKVVAGLVGRSKFSLAGGGGERGGAMVPTESFGISDLRGRLEVRVERR